MITLNQQHDLNNISLTEIGNNTFQSLSFLFITKFSESMIRGESTKIVKDEFSEFLRLEFDLNRVTCSWKGQLSRSRSLILKIDCLLFSFSIFSTAYPKFTCENSEKTKMRRTEQKESSKLFEIRFFHGWNNFELECEKRRGSLCKSRIH